VAGTELGTSATESRRVNHPVFHTDGGHFRDKFTRKSRERAAGSATGRAPAAIKSIFAGRRRGRSPPPPAPPPRRAENTRRRRRPTEDGDDDGFSVVGASGRQPIKTAAAALT